MSGRAPAIAEGHVSVVTMNTWRLRGPRRVERLYETLSAVGEDLGITVDGDRLPDVIAFEELEDQRAIDALRARLAGTHHFQSVLCARKLNGDNRSVLGLAVRRARFEVSEARVIPLGILVPDHPRCAMRVSIRPKDSDVELTLVATHLSMLPWNAVQARVLVDALRRDGALDRSHLLVTGDFNFAPNSGGYRALTTSPLRDAFGRDRRRTHWAGGRIDHIFVTPSLAMVRPLDQHVAFRATRPSDRLTIPSRCHDAENSDCPASDHLPEGAVFRYESRARVQ